MATTPQAPESAALTLSLRQLAWTPERRRQQGEKMSGVWADPQQRENLCKALSDGNRKALGQRISVTQVADYFGLSASTLRKLWNTGRLHKRPEGGMTPAYLNKIKPQIEAYKANLAASRSEAARTSWTPERREKQPKKAAQHYADHPEAVENQRKNMLDHWNNLSPQQRLERSAKSIAHNRSAKGRTKISKGTAEALKSPEVRQRISTGVRNVWAERNEIMRKARAKGITAEVKTRGGQRGRVLPRTRARVTLAAYYFLQGLTAYGMIYYLYPNASADTFENARQATYDLLRRYKDAVNSERSRLATLSDAGRQLEMQENEKLIRKV